MTRQEWVSYSRPESLAVFDRCIELLSQNGKAPRITYNAEHIAVGGVKKNFSWFSPRRQKAHCMIDIRVGEPNLETLLKKLDDAKIEAYRQGNGFIRMRLTTDETSKNRELVKEAFEFGITEGGGL